MNLGRVMSAAFGLIGFIVLLSSAAVAQSGAPRSAAPSKADPTLGSRSLIAQMTPSEQQAEEALERDGYTQITDIRSGPEGVSARAIKDGREVSVIVDSSGKIRSSRSSVSGAQIAL